MKCFARFFLLLLRRRRLLRFCLLARKKKTEEKQENVRLIFLLLFCRIRKEKKHVVLNEIDENISIFFLYKLEKNTYYR